MQRPTHELFNLIQKNGCHVHRDATEIYMHFIMGLLFVSVGHGTQAQSLYTLSINLLLQILKKKPFKTPTTGNLLIIYTFRESKDFML